MWQKINIWRWSRETIGSDTMADNRRHRLISTGHKQFRPTIWYILQLCWVLCGKAMREQYNRIS
jgi:hypothetical protein